MRPPSPSIPEKDFFAGALRQGLRLDGRAPLEPRSPVLAFGAELGTVNVSLGKTRVLAHVQAHMVRPPPERPYEGVVSVHAELAPMAGAEYEAGRPSEEEVALVRMLDKVVRRSDALDKESLCVLAGQRVWHVRLTLHVLSDAGNLLDCAVLAALAALRHFRRPEVEVVGDTVTVHSPDTRAPLPLSLNHSPFCFSFALFPPSVSGTGAGAVGAGAQGARALLDPAGLEATLAEGMLSIALNAQREICVLHKAGGVPLAPGELMSLVQVAAREAAVRDKVVGSALKEDWERRRVAVEVR